MNNTTGYYLKWATEKLKKSQIPNPTKEVRLILNLILKQSHPELIPPTQTLSLSQITKFQHLIAQRCAHKPFAYLAGYVTFCGLDIRVNQSVLIPRPETEELVEIITNHLKRYTFPVIASEAWQSSVIPEINSGQALNQLCHPRANSVILESEAQRGVYPVLRGGDIGDQRRGSIHNLSIVEVGTGSGAISIALAKNLPDVKIAATDISSTALREARHNINSHHLSKRVTLKKSDLLSSITGPIDILIANLPYIPSRKLKTLSPDITNYEPQIALNGGPDGLELISKLLSQAKTKLFSKTVIFLEIWHTHAMPLQRLTRQLFPQANLTIKKDLSGKNRFAIIKLRY